MSELGLKPYRDIINPIPPCWNSISLDWYQGLLKEAEELTAPRTCDTCKWWGCPENDLSEYWEPFKYRQCNGAERYDDLTQSYSPDGASIDGFEMGSSPEIITGPKFGCIHHEPK